MEMALTENPDVDIWFSRIASYGTAKIPGQANGNPPTGFHPGCRRREAGNIECRDARMASDTLT